MLPVACTHVCAMSPVRTAAGGHTKILPRMPAAVSAVAFVNGAFNLIFATSLDGKIPSLPVFFMTRTELQNECPLNKSKSYASSAQTCGNVTCSKSVYLADLNRPEDSHLSRTKLPHLAVE
eukprot:scaffold265922_cov18-Tisochrysis_lutea.AAC.1